MTNRLSLHTRCFPNFSTDLSKLEAISRYWDMYYERVEKLGYAD
jgi:hypothetical protein